MSLRIAISALYCDQLSQVVNTRSKKEEKEKEKEKEKENRERGC
jgi:hypothetical protein